MLTEVKYPIFDEPVELHAESRYSLSPFNEGVIEYMRRVLPPAVVLGISSTGAFAVAEGEPAPTRGYLTIVPL